MGCKVLARQEIQQVEARVLESIPSLLLMENAGRYVAERVAAELDTGSTALVLCGMGKNGGDGYVAARQLMTLGVQTMVWAVGGTANLSGDTLTMMRAAQASGVAVHDILTTDDLEACSWQIAAAAYIVDALTGLGLNRPIEGLMADVIGIANRADAPICAIDIPSGIDADSGQILGRAIHADVTVTFFAHKPGQILTPGRLYCGETLVVPLCRIDCLPRDGESGELIERHDVGRYLLPRPLDAQKGDFGRALLVAGSVGMAGAAGMAAYAAVRSGTGLLCVAAPQSVAQSLWSRVPEAMTFPVPEANGKLCAASIPEISRLLEDKTCAAIGPGLGKGEGIADVVIAMSRTGIPLVIDADGLNAVAERIDELKDSLSPLILTPHPGEMARMLGCDVDTVRRAPVEAARSLSERIGAVVLLKGSTSVIASFDGRLSYNIAGGPQLAKGGSGDVLTGIILALLSQGLTPYHAARIGSLVLGRASECVQKDEKSVLARDVIEAIPMAYAR